MCGIAGAITRDPDVARKAVLAMDDAQAHRGPNDRGEHALPFGQRWLGLGHRRLSIIDLSSAGHQPMVHPGTGDQIIFNGEIYNFGVLRQELLAAGESFTGHSDTEVLLHALARWGPDVIARLEGMYAFAFYDARRQTLLLARDPLGIKPLYLAEVDAGLVFASEVRALLASGLVARRVDRAGLAGLLAYGCLQFPRTLFQGVRSFPPGTYQVFGAEAGGAAEAAVRFWDFPRPDSSLGVPQAVEAVRATVDVAVRDHLVADVPVGVFLSSGVDSTIVAAVAAKYSPHIRSFTVGFADEPDLSEAPLAAETAAAFGLEHTSLTINGPDALAATLEWVDALDQPSVDGLNVYVISKAVRREGMTVALSGQGGDELFGGYPAFADVPRLQAMMRKLAWLPGGARAALGGAAALGKSRAVRDKLRDMLRTDGSALELSLQRRRAMSARQLQALGVDPPALGLGDNCQPPEALAGVRTDPDVFAAVSQFESRFYQANMLLRDADVNGMAHALEIRVPLLDQRLANLAYSLPGAVRRPAGQPPKYLLRAAFPEALRPALAGQAKRGFGLPVRRWMLGPLRELCEQSLADLKRREVLRPDGVDALWRQFLGAPESPIWTRAFTLVVLGNYLRRHASAG